MKIDEEDENENMSTGQMQNKKKHFPRKIQELFR